MELPYTKSLPKGGFSFENYQRNKTLVERLGMKPPTETSTGTTIVGVIFKDGVALATDTRATAGPIVGDKNCLKLHYLAPNVYTCGAGTAADCDHVNEMVRRDMQLHRLRTSKETRVAHVTTKLSHHLFRHMGHLGVHTIVGGVDVKGPQLVEIDSHGHTQYNPFLTMGSGSLAAMAILESGY